MRAVVLASIVALLSAASLAACSSEHLDGAVPQGDVPDAGAGGDVDGGLDAPLDAAAAAITLDDLCAVGDDDRPSPIPAFASTPSCAGGNVDAPGPLFTTDAGAFPAEYGALHSLCARMSSAPLTPDALTDAALAADVRAFLRSLLPRPALTRALADVTGGDDARVEALVDVWLRANAFEHVMCGELNPNGTVSGLHEWSELYLAEREGRLDFACVRGPATDTTVATISYRWTPPDSTTPADKPTGSTFVGVSPACYLALGYRAVANRIPGQPGTTPAFSARSYGVTRSWVLGLDGKSIITMYPLGEP